MLKDLGVALGAALLLSIVSSIVGLPLENTSQPKAFTRQRARKPGGLQPSSHVVSPEHKGLSSVLNWLTNNRPF
ncbi:hypothetical protein AUG19_09375 [archaeon 13_1_20CM_2_54_9]|nr:MAG: hypothetical protein AUG19_09375 [archaeon 13_1_20CM_2_54_9]